MKSINRSAFLLLLCFLFVVPVAQVGAQQTGDSQKSPAKAVIPFHPEGNSIILTLRLNDSDRPLSFLLDTGADGMAIRKSLADSLGLTVSRSQSAEVVGGKMQVSISSGNTVHLAGGLSIDNQNVAIFEKILNYDGIIGLNLVHRYITEVNFDERQIYLYAHGDLPSGGDNRIALPIKRFGPLVLIPAEISLTGGDMLAGNFIMDTGAHYNMVLFSRFVRQNRLLLSGFKPQRQAALVSMGVISPVFYGQAHALKVGGDTMLTDFEVALQASTGAADTGGQLPDGSVGIQFFSRFNFTIDLPGNMVYLEARKTETPL